MKILDFPEPFPNNLSRALNIALTPTIFFFNFMDYTDSASVCLVTVMFYYSLSQSEFRLGLISLLAIFVRQNNVIWILYLIIYRIISDHRKQIMVPKSLLSHFVSIIKILFAHKWQKFRSWWLPFSWASSKYLTREGWFSETMNITK